MGALDIGSTVFDARARVEEAIKEEVNAAKAAETLRRTGGVDGVHGTGGGSGGAADGDGRLQYLNLAGNSLGPLSAAALAALIRHRHTPPLRSLHTLDAVHNPLLLSAPRALLVREMLTSAMLHPIPPPPPPPAPTPRPPTAHLESASVSLSGGSKGSGASSSPQLPASPASARSFAGLKIGGGSSGGGIMSLLAAARGEAEGANGGGGVREGGVGGGGGRDGEGGGSRCGRAATS